MTSPFTGQVNTVGAAEAGDGEAEGWPDRAGLGDAVEVVGVDGLGELWGDTDGFSGVGEPDCAGVDVTTTWVVPDTAVPPPVASKEEKR